MSASRRRKAPLGETAPRAPWLSEAVAALAEALRFERPADAVLSRFFRERPHLGQRDRGEIAERVYAVLRHRRSLETWAGRTNPRALLLAWLVRGEGWSLARLEPWLEKGERAWLAERKAATPVLSRAERLDAPDWLIERLDAAYGPPETEALLTSSNRPAPLDLRINPWRTTREAVLARLQADGIDCAPTPFSPLGIRVRGKPALHAHPFFQDGMFEVQDEGSQLVTLLVAPRRGQTVVDFCAGAGGKTLQLAAALRNTGQVYAFDVSAGRLAKLKPRLVRSGLTNVQPMVLAHENDERLDRLAGKVDRVLVDAPCSGLGTLRRNPDLKWRQQPTLVEELIAKQRAILQAAARLVRPGGHLVYVTCSLLPEENETVLETFLARESRFSLLDPWPSLFKSGVPEQIPRWEIPTADALVDRFSPTVLRLAPHVHGTDGFFAAVLARNASP
ncbi:RsmB/NOP family class I SAM-dependent RNA methyltransferase [Tepidiphilus baoligensis]|uniref:RsmB/NOP family class I SAM-dependent RNA methyltransferase n=1 Tax=Tepidiphilus baoligensis TaxID=2698687 RepID=UPI0019D583DC|nr:RsmB/NOP family class I SAM-dependent RNA methyltransferase [Tepidiphilus baoligensis]